MGRIHPLSQTLDSGLDFIAKNFSKIADISAKFYANIKIFRASVDCFVK
jgi:hypothetical protein